MNVIYLTALTLFAWTAEAQAQWNPSDSEYYCEQDTQSESGSTIMDASFAYVEIKKADAGSTSTHVCVVGMTGGGWGVEPVKGNPLPCNLTANGDTVLVKDVGPELRLAIDESSYRYLGLARFDGDPEKTYGAEYPRKPDMDADSRLPAFGSIRGKVEKGLLKTAMKGHRYLCKRTTRN